MTRSHELEVLLGTLTMLASPSLRGLLVETFRSHHWRDPKLRQIEDLLERRGFLPYDGDPGGSVLLPLRKPDEGADNTFSFRDSEEAMARREGARGKAGAPHGKMNGA